MSKSSGAVKAWRRAAEASIAEPAPEFVAPHALIRLPGDSVAHAPTGIDSLFVARRLEEEAEGAVHLHIAADSQDATRFVAMANFVAPKLRCLVLPAWDCLPYDRVSPTHEVMANRLTVLADLAQSDQGAGKSTLVVVTVNALLQRLPPPEAMLRSQLTVAPGQRVDREGLLHQLADLGYRRCSSVVEGGEHAVRGSLVDVFPMGAETPFRLDFFGPEIDSIRTFDPLTQRSLGKVDRLKLTPSSEVSLDARSVERFKVRFLQEFGAVTDDPLLESVGQGRNFPGMEHWLPLFYDDLATIFDYLPEALTYSLDDQVDAAIAAREETITEHHAARQTPMRFAGHQSAPYRALDPERLYLDPNSIVRRLKPNTGFRFVKGDVPPGQDKGLDAGGAVGRDFAAERRQRDVPLFKVVTEHLEALLGRHDAVVVAAQSEGARARLEKILTEAGLPHLPAVDRLKDAEDRGFAVSATIPLETGFVEPGLAVLTERDLLGDRLQRGKTKKRKSERLISEVTALKTGDHVVHLSHGIGRFEGLETIDIGGAPHDCARLIYAGNDKLFLPVENLDVLSRYGGSDDRAQLDRLGGAGWQSRKAAVKQRIKELADQLIRVAAERKLKKGVAMQQTAGLYEEFCARFPFEETDDQINAIDAVLGDLASGQPMDRLVCGDVGFGKTEVALRAAFVAAMTGRQVAILAPTTLLVRQHFRTFLERFQGFPLRVEMISRFVPAKQATKTKQEVAAGTVDIVIGTHALLGKSVSFADLGLLIVDEEQHFGVAHKERLKELRSEVHVLTMTATPIPRTLQMALGGLKELSIIATPPVDRLAVRSFVLPSDPVVIREALMREHFRGGQSFYVCPRIEDQMKLAREIGELVPELKVAVANGRLPAAELEEIMVAFDDGQIDVLLATNIIESGLDIPRANTMIVHRADRFGLSQLYQLRGRIGRGKVRGYAYFTVPPNRVLQETAERRLSVMETIDGLGAGFQVASHDMDIRGHGNILGDEQSGHIKEVGFELYNQLLQDALDAARQAGFDKTEDAPADTGWTPQITIDVPALMPESYVADLDLRLSLYRRLSALADEDDIQNFGAELIDRFGPLPKETDNLLVLIRLKQACRRAQVEKLDAGPKGLVIAFKDNSHPRPDRLVRLISESGGGIRVRPDHRLVVLKKTASADERLARAQEFVGTLAELAA